MLNSRDGIIRQLVEIERRKTEALDTIRARPDLDEIIKNALRFQWRDAKLKSPNAKSVCEFLKTDSSISSDILTRFLSGFGYKSIGLNLSLEFVNAILSEESIKSKIIGSDDLFAEIEYKGVIPQFSPPLKQMPPPQPIKQMPPLPKKQFPSAAAPKLKYPNLTVLNEIKKTFPIYLNPDMIIFKLHCHNVNKNFSYKYDEEDIILGLDEIPPVILLNIKRIINASRQEEENKKTHGNIYEKKSILVIPIQLVAEGYHADNYELFIKLKCIESYYIMNELINVDMTNKSFSEVRNYVVSAARYAQNIPKADDVFLIEPNEFWNYDVLTFENFYRFITKYLKIKPSDINFGTRGKDTFFNMEKEKETSSISNNIVYFKSIADRICMDVKSGKIDLRTGLPSDAKNINFKQINLPDTSIIPKLTKKTATQKKSSRAHAKDTRNRLNAAQIKNMTNEIQGKLKKLNYDVQIIDNPSNPNISFIQVKKNKQPAPVSTKHTREECKRPASHKVPTQPASHKVPATQSVFDLD